MTELPWVQERFDDHVKATTFLVEKIYELHFKGHTFRAVELSHSYDFGADKDTWCVFIRVFPLDL
jgi:hypothetical protein